MTNIARWKEYFRTIHAPAQFVEAGFYFAISAAMERRVWVSSGSNKIYANQFVLFVAPAGVGKGLVTNVVDYALRENKQPDNKEDPLIRFGPTSGSYQRLIGRMAERSKIKPYTENGKVISYAYASAVVVLDEFTSFFTESANEAVTFFCQVWTGNIPYERDTNSKGLKFIKNPSLSLIAGTTPKNLQKLLKYDIIGTGLDRRMLIVYAAQNEWRQFEIPHHTPDQEAAMAHIVAHIRKLTEVVGPLVYTDEARDYCIKWWADPKANIVSNHPMLREYHPNKNSLLHKLAISIHMSEGEPAERITQPIDLATVKEAIRMLQSYEAHRGLAWSESGANHNYGVAMRVSEWLKSYGPANKARLYDVFFAEVNCLAFDEIINYLVTSQRIRIILDGATVTYEHNNTRAEL